MTALLQLRDLRVEFPVRDAVDGGSVLLRAVDGVDLDIGKADCVGLVGESGCGKSTLANVLMGLVEPVAGQVLFDGADVTKHRDPGERRRIQMVFQDPASSLNPRRRVRSVLAELIQHHDLVPAAGLESALRGLIDMVGLPYRVLDARPRELSGGQRQRVAIARALAVQPEVLVADEAVSALDVSAQAKVINLLADLRRELGLTLVFISHDLGVVRALCDRVVVMYLGRIVEDAPAEELFEAPQHPYTTALLNAVPDLAPRRRVEGPALEGEPVSALSQIGGCRFRSRCPRAIAECAEQDPPYVVSGPHRTACLRVAEAAHR
ncbi:oligopeptide/dipeptide ABC transporter ATP-binding protein [Amycolatopsis jejuensis]|uniref:oligopeptide/dipeptide ABC transporter ATP-binding protein n=1 Tax=Amycolatopsis jejuensis TaxID=330084 RepID=UPI000524B560|nr:ABC transporter ATP-binding protein [Amycolatopsis jejuensis]